LNSPHFTVHTYGVTTVLYSHFWDEFSFFSKTETLQGSHSVLEFKDVPEKSWNLIIWGNVLEKSWNVNILQKCPGNVLEFFSKIHKNVSFLYIKLQIFLGGDTPERPSGCWDPNLAPVNLFGIVNCYYIVNNTAADSEATMFLN
jgi:hypothetical protein